MIYEKPVYVELRKGSFITQDKNEHFGLFQEATVTKLAVTQSISRYQMKAADIIFPMIPNMSLSGSNGLDTSALQSWEFLRENAPFSQALNFFFKKLSFKDW